MSIRYLSVFPAVQLPKDTTLSLLRRPINATVMLLLLSAMCLSQSTVDKSTTYILEPVSVSNVAYPPAAREQKIQGHVVAMFLVSEAGDVENVNVYKMDAVLSEATKQAILAWKFKPVTKDGKAIPVIAKATLDFVPGMEEKGVAAQIDPASEFPERVRISQGVSQGLLLNKVVPVYPAGAKGHGAVSLVLSVGKDGAVTDVQFQSGPSELVPAAVDAARQWRYRPYLLLGRPVPIQTTVLFNFN